jgi:hypothetical protein
MSIQKNWSINQENMSKLSNSDLYALLKMCAIYPTFPILDNEIKSELDKRISELIVIDDVSTNT